jgi:hypothetical protein
MNKPVNNSGFSGRILDELLPVMSNRDGVQYTSYTTLNFSRPAVCLTTDNGDQKTVSLETAKAIMREERISHE